MIEGQVFGTLSVWELTMLLVNVFGLILAVAAMGEALMDAEAIRILGQRGLIAGADVRQRLLKARGSRRDEGIKVLIHLVLLTVGIIIAASPAPRETFEAFTAFWSVLGIIVIAAGLSIGSVFTLIDRRALWAMFDAEEETERAIQDYQESPPMLDPAIHRGDEPQGGPP